MTIKSITLFISVALITLSFVLIGNYNQMISNNNQIISNNNLLLSDGGNMSDELPSSLDPRYQRALKKIAEVPSKNIAEIQGLIDNKPFWLSKSIPVSEGGWVDVVNTTPIKKDFWISFYMEKGYRYLIFGDNCWIEGQLKAVGSPLHDHHKIYDPEGAGSIQKISQANGFTLYEYTAGKKSTDVSCPTGTLFLQENTETPSFY